MVFNRVNRTGERESMPIWKIEPAAGADDPRWLDSVRWHEVVVRADSPAMAIAVAARELGARDHGIGNESPAGRTGLEDEKLYHVRRLAPTDEPAQDDGSSSEPRVISAVGADAATEEWRIG